jgi:hypothetical protein
MLTEKSVEQIGALHPEVRQRVIVHRHTTAQPPIHIMGITQPLQGATLPTPSLVA